MPKVVMVVKLARKEKAAFQPLFSFNQSAALTSSSNHTGEIRSLANERKSLQISLASALIV